jgi:hypothetical protein
LEVALATQSGAAPQQLLHISEELRQAQGRADFPTRQIPQWLWVASQYRIYAENKPTVAAKAGASLQLLSRKLQTEQLGEEDIQDLNWVLESAVRKLAQEVGPADLRGCLREEEIEHIEERLSTYDDNEPFDVDATRGAAERQVKLLLQFRGMGDLIGLQTKIEALFASATRPGQETAPARAALRYLAEEEDAVCDRSGVLGLVDDIYVIEWAYAAVESQTRCLPLLQTMLRRWPFIGSNMLGEDGNLPLDRYARYVTCSALFTLFGPTSGCLVVRDPGAFPIIAAVASGLELARLQVGRFEEEIELWREGDPITISDGTDVFRAVFGGRIRVGEKTRYRLHVRDRGTITVGDEVLPYLSKTSRLYKRLSKGQEIAAWLQDRHVDPLTNLTGMGRRRPQFQEAVLLVGPKWKLDEYLDCLRPLGSSPAALLGVRWIDGQQQAVDVGGTSTDRPLIYACADPSTGCELISEPPGHVVGWKVIVDGARNGRTLHAALATADRLGTASLCVFGELAEREATAELIAQGVRGLWYLEDQDVSVPKTHHVAPRAGSNPLVRFIDRQSNHWAAIQILHLTEDPFLEELALCVQERASSKAEEPAMQTLDYAVASFLRQAISNPLSMPGRDELLRLARIIAAQASVLSSYNDTAPRFRDLFRRFVDEGGNIAGRKTFLAEIAAAAPVGESIAVVCRSSSIAAECKTDSANDPVLANLDWMNLETLRRKAPFDRVLVPGWLDRRAMREIASNGYGARTELVLLPFEKAWFDNTVAAARRWEKRLEGATVATLRGVAAALTDRQIHTARWQEQTNRRLEETPNSSGSEPDDRSDADILEERSIEALARSVPTSSAGQATAKAQLVLFEEAGAYALLPPHGRTIVLSAPGERSDATSITAADAERQLFRNVSDLEPGMVLALPEATDRDLIDARADVFLADPEETRTLAGMWKLALKRTFDAGADDPVSFAQRMAAAGEARDSATIRSWVNDSKSVAPRNYRHVVPLLAELTGDEGLVEHLSEVLSSIDLLYRARARAAEALLRDIFSGEIDLDAAHLSVKLSDRDLSFALHRVRRCAGIREVSSDMIGRVLSFSVASVETVRLRA